VLGYARTFCLIDDSASHFLFVDAARGRTAAKPILMKKVIYFALATALAVSCGSAKKAVGSENPDQQTPIKTVTTIEGEQVKQETIKMVGVDMEKTLSEDGTKIIERPFKWFAGTAKSPNKQVAIEMAQREAYATISRVLNNAVIDNAEKGLIANNSNIQEALRLHWEQVSSSLVRACEPYGEAIINYSQSSKMYSVVAKVGIRGDKFNQLLNSAGSFEPSGLNKDELQSFIEINKSIMEAAKGN